MKRIPFAFLFVVVPAFFLGSGAALAQSNPAEALDDATPAAVSEAVQDVSNAVSEVVDKPEATSPPPPQATVTEKITQDEAAWAEKRAQSEAAFAEKRAQSEAAWAEKRAQSEAAYTEQKAQSEAAWAEKRSAAEE